MIDRLTAAWGRLGKRQRAALAVGVVALAVVLFVVRSRRARTMATVPAGAADDADTAVIPTQPAGGTRTVGGGGGGGGGGGVDLGGAPPGTPPGTPGTTTGTVAPVTTTTTTVTSIPGNVMVARLPTAGTRPGQALPSVGTAVTDSPFVTADPYGGAGYFGTGNLGFAPEEIARGGNVIVAVGEELPAERAGGIPIPAVADANRAVGGGATVVNAALPDLTAWRGKTASAQSIAILRGATPEQLASPDWRSTFNALVQAEGGTLRV